MRAADENLYRYCDDGPTDGVDPSGTGPYEGVAWAGIERNEAIAYVNDQLRLAHTTKDAIAGDLGSVARKMKTGMNSGGIYYVTEEVDDIEKQASLVFNSLAQARTKLNEVGITDGDIQNTLNAYSLYAGNLPDRGRNVLLTRGLPAVAFAKQEAVDAE